MGWSLGYLPIKEPELLDAYLLSLGKAVYLASCFEHKCRYVLRIAKLVDFGEENDRREPDAFTTFAQGLTDRMLGPTLRELGLQSLVTPEYARRLDDAREARNWIAHEAGAMTDLHGISAKMLAEQTVELGKQLDILVAGDNLISRWVYEIEDKEAAPREIQQRYPALVRNWVFA